MIIQSWLGPNQKCLPVPPDGSPASGWKKSEGGEVGSILDIEVCNWYFLRWEKVTNMQVGLVRHEM